MCANYLEFLPILNVSMMILSMQGAGVIIDDKAKYHHTYKTKQVLCYAVIK